MSKKTYNQPSVKVIELEMEDLLLQGSQVEPQTFSLNEEEVGEYTGKPETKPNSWGVMW